MSHSYWQRGQSAEKRVRPRPSVSKAKPRAETPESDGCRDRHLRRDSVLLKYEPELVAQIEFTEWTPDGHLRHSKFVGLREDKDARKVLREIED